jgi:hypothetical protein
MEVEYLGVEPFSDLGCSLVVVGSAASIIAITKLRYWSTWIRFCTAAGVRPSR